MAKKTENGIIVLLSAVYKKVFIGYGYCCIMVNFAKLSKWTDFHFLVRMLCIRNS